MTTERDELEQSERLTAGATASPADLPDTTAEAHPSEPDRGRYGVLRVAMQLLRIGPLLIAPDPHRCDGAPLAVLPDDPKPRQCHGRHGGDRRPVDGSAPGHPHPGHRSVRRLDPGARVGRRGPRLQRRRLRRRRDRGDACDRRPDRIDQRRRLREGAAAAPLRDHARDAEHRPRARPLALRRATDPGHARGGQRDRWRQHRRLVPRLGRPGPRASPSSCSS